MSATAPVGPWDIEGEIERLQWVAAIRLSAQPMMSGTLEGDRDFPAHYRLWLRVTRLTPSPSVLSEGDFEPDGQLPTMTVYNAPSQPLSWRSRLMAFIQGQPARSRRSLSPIRVTQLKLPHPQNDQFLQVGMQIRITEYCEFGDEGGTWSKYQTIIIQSVPD